MPTLSLGGASVPPPFAAAVVLLAIELLADTPVSLPTASVVIDALGSSRSAAYAARASLEGQLAGLVRRPGRPAKPDDPEPRAAVLTNAAQVQREAFDFLLRNPGAASQGEHRRRYSDPYRLFVLDLAPKHPDLDLASLAEAVRVPLGTLKDWLSGGRAEVEKGLQTVNAATAHERVTQPRIEAVLQAYRGWKGTFVDFCTHIQHHLRIPFPRDLLADLLEAEGLRKPSHRPARRSPDAEAIRKQFQTFFAGAQAVADGSAVPVRIGSETFTLNLELTVDTHTAAWTGGAVTPTEDSAALLAAIEDARQTTGESPIAVLTDNKPSNHASEVHEALAKHSIIPIRATLYRPENKAHVEGAFGLFKSHAPELVLESLEPAEIARRVLELVIITFGRALNHKIRPDREQSRVQQYQTDRPTDEQRAQARAALQARADQQEQARQRQRPAIDPALRDHLDAAFAELVLDDPDRRCRDAIARYPADAVLAGLAIFRAKRERRTLPAGAGARYLLGIVRNVAEEDEGYAIAEAIWKERLAARDRVLAHLERQFEQTELDAEDAADFLQRLIDRAMATDRQIDRSFWLRGAADLLLDEEPAQRTRLFRLAARRIHGTRRVPPRQRSAATRRLAAMAAPVA